MLAMQVPDGKKAWVPVGDQSGHLEALKLTEIDASGMAFHKAADEAWTGMPLPPHKDPQPRYLSQPSTAATLNLAATAAQCARVWKDTDAAYAKRCLAAAEKAWKSAKSIQTFLPTTTLSVQARMMIPKWMMSSIGLRRNCLPQQAKLNISMR